MSKTWADVWRFRGELYSFLANCLLEPIQKDNKQILTSNFWHHFPMEAANPQLNSGLEQLVDCTSTLEVLNIDEAIEKVLVEYTELFIGSATPKAPPIQSYYFSNKKQLFGEATYEMKSVLNEHGLESKTKDRQPEDHLGLELLFISVLTEKLNDLNEEDHMANIREQIQFIGKHLLTWVPRLCSDAKNHGSVGFYGGLIELVWGTLLWDKKLLEEYVNSDNHVTQ